VYHILCGGSLVVERLIIYEKVGYHFISVRM